MTDPTWKNPEVFRQVQQGLDLVLSRRKGQLQALFSLTFAIQGLILDLDKDLEGVCSKTCPWCPEPCCLLAEVCYDFRDLLFLHCQQQALPLAQPGAWQNQACSLLGSQGCRLPRTLRPFLCTWYICPWQMKILRSCGSSRLQELPARLQLLQEKRKKLEAEFLRLVQA